jgi:hypothetical protein
MQVTCDTSKLEQSLKKFHEEAVRKMQGMVQKFSYIVAWTAIDNTPLGDSIKWESLYLKREKSIGLEPIEGFAKGSWRVSMDGTLEMQTLYGQDSDEMAASLIRQDLNQYKLGETVMISNFGPYIVELEKNFTRYNKQQPIVQPTMESVYRTYQLSLDDYYKAS